MVHGPTGKQVSGRNEGAGVTVANQRAGCAGPFSSPNEPRPGQDRGGRQAQDAGQRVAAATGSSRGGDGGEVGRDRVGRHGHPSRS
jgi:hypothetical protein